MGQQTRTDATLLEATWALRQCLALEPEDSEALDVMERLGEVPEELEVRILESCREALAPKSADAYFNLGAALVWREQPSEDELQEGLQALQHCLELAPDRGYASLVLSVVGSSATQVDFPAKSVRDSGERSRHRVRAMRRA